MDKKELINIFNNHYPQDVTLEKINSEEVDLGEYVDEFEDVLKSRLNVVDDFGLEGEDLKNNTEIFNKLKDLIKEIKLDEIDRKDLLIDRLELFLQRDCFVDCK